MHRLHILLSRLCRPALVATAILAVALPLLTAGAAKAGPTLLFDARTGEVLHAYKPFDRWYPASLTKLMTVYVALDAVEHRLISLNSPVTISAAAAAQPPSKMDYKVGTQITVDDAIRILMVKSANDVAVALAEAVGGSEDRFVAGMNRAAARLGMTDTNFVNPHGLPDSRQVSSARDLALLSRAIIMKFPQHQHYFSLPSIQIGGQLMKNHNKLIGQFRGADGMKTGFICSGGFNVVSSATRNGRRLVVVVLGALNSRRREEVAAALLEAGFAQGSGFDLFSRSRTKLTDLRRPSNLLTPVDMRPYVCQGNTAPADLVSFGFDDAPATGAGEAAAALAMAPDSILRKPQRPTEVAVPLDPPAPAARPFEQQGEPAAPVRASMSGIPLPVPNPLRLPAGGLY
ncbi:D-alanyl-D-alanine carboxypeptidase family protein [Lutibaculum baratangense]|uniref:D-alanyl-D-alanine carboxypeptidase n=1 Tax=Lutibaculum baratangense AMV1 TaxID=631454 RepID=V4QWK9_9HYPH|nr:D-alanyl-D-alanine carboxypeptidase family protein [Lutibaculum baratangense]ESR24132.1 D-alanyl-D-alanine carboxypeptidase [Lutibaculum baratangense AMV1]